MKLSIINSIDNDYNFLSESIKDYLASQHITCNIITFNNGQEFLHGFTADKYNAIFLDIYLIDTDGMSIAYEIRKTDKDCLIIFVTSSQTHAIESFRVRAFYYLLKPYTKENFNEMMDLCCSKLSKDSHYIKVKERKTYVYIFYSHIVYIDTCGHYIQIHTKDRIVKSRMQFKEIMDLLMNDKRFIICYRNILVNLEMVETISQSDFVLKNGELVPIQNKHLNQVRQAFIDYIFHKET